MYKYVLFTFGPVEYDSYFWWIIVNLIDVFEKE